MNVVLVCVHVCLSVCSQVMSSVYRRKYDISAMYKLEPVHFALWHARIATYPVKELFDSCPCVCFVSLWGLRAQLFVRYGRGHGDAVVCTQYVAFRQNLSEVHAAVYDKCIPPHVTCRECWAERGVKVVLLCCVLFSFLLVVICFCLWRARFPSPPGGAIRIGNVKDVSVSRCRRERPNATVGCARA